MRSNLLLLPAGILALLSSAAAAQLPYNPTRIFVANNGSLAYVFTPQSSSSQASLSALDISDTVQSADTAKVLFSRLPFLSTSSEKSFTPVADQTGITVLAGHCADNTDGLGLWRFTPDSSHANGTWSSLQVVVDDKSLGANFLSAGFSFSQDSSTSNGSLYVFGGMCPNTQSESASTWTSDATYSNTMLTLTQDGATNAGTPYQLSMTGARAPPIPEAGLTVTPLTPTFSDSTSSNTLQQQNVVLLGGHTQQAFINMSQVALFSLPQQSWAFIGADQPAGANTELMPRDSTSVEPRSGHTAVLTEDGSRIIVYGGWVGDTSTPAQPQLAVLNIGEGYGGSGDWAWSIPSQDSVPYGSTSGVYGHGAALLPGGVMLVTGGRQIGGAGSKSRRDQSNTLFFLNTTSMTWTDSYLNPQSPNSPAYIGHPQSSTTGLKKTDKVGLGAGLGLGLAAVAGIVVIWLLYSRKLRQKRAIREKELRELALGAERYMSPSLDGAPDHRYPDRRSASWHSMQERRIESAADETYPWAPTASREQANSMNMEREDVGGNGLRQAERTGIMMDVPSPTRGLRRNLHSKGPMGFGIFQPSGLPGGVFRIDEEEEGSRSGSLKRSRTPKDAVDRNSTQSDPFKDPPQTADSTNDEAEQRKREIQGWVEDWQSAAESMNISRNPSQAHSRTYSNLSQAYSQYQSSNSDPSGRGSPDKSDRTGSNLSERSQYSQASFQRSVSDTISRNISQRSASAGYALFSGAAAAMSRITGGKQQQADYGTTSNITRAPSNRSVSLQTKPASSKPQTRERAETVSSVKSTAGPMQPGEDQALLTRFGSLHRGAQDDYWTPPQSPVKDRERYARTGSLTKTGAKALGLLGSVKRVFTGTGTVDVSGRVAALESRSEQSSPTKSQPEMAESSPQRSISANQAFWRSKRGAKDWDAGGETETSPGVHISGTIRRKPVPGQARPAGDEDWDVEEAVQNRVVQVMFTVPKEKLRVVNADALSLLSSNRSDVDHDEDKDREKEVKRMSSVREGDEEEEESPTDEKGKWPLRS